ncbi:MAG TPA: tetratricopeptide repeat protein [Polyangiaceae bacterium]|nr:tetratricopeptide repeat protein [Polyangiaceae bacterium]
MKNSCFLSLRAVSAVVALAAFSAACSEGSGHADYPPVAKQWLERGTKSYEAGDFEDAELAVENALRAAPGRPEAMLLAGRVSLARLDYDRAVQVLNGLTSGEARGVRGRALWYRGDVQKAADELDLLLRDPDVRDGWAVEIVKLARRGVGRKPFEMSGGLLAVTEMPRTGSASMIVPLEIDGSPALGMIATGTAEAVMDAGAGAEPSWVSLRFGERIEVHDVPVLAKDLSGLSKQVNAPIKILLGVNLLRHLHPTIDFSGGQFVVRTFEPPPPPAATTVRLSYARGGGMMVRGALGSGEAAPACSFLIDTSLAYPLALAGSGWTKAGVPLSSLKEVPNSGSLKAGVVPSLRLGAFDVPHVPGLQGDGVLKERGEGLGVNIDGLLGSGLLATFRMTLIDGGRSMWLEDLPAEALEPPPPIVLPAESEVITDDDSVPADADAVEEDDAPPAKGKAKSPAKKPAGAAKKP